MTAKDIDEEFNQLLRKSQLSSDTFTFDELSTLACAFLPTNPNVDTLRPKGYVVLSAICQGKKNSERTQENDDVAKQHLARIFTPILMQLFGGTNEVSLLTGACFLTALFQVDARVASAIFLTDGLVEALMDIIDTLPSPLLSQEIARLLGQVCGHKTCRRMITPQMVQWLETKSRQSTDLGLQTAASLALIKLSKGIASDTPENETPEGQINEADSLAKTMVAAVLSRRTHSSLDAIEGLAYLSTDPSLKEDLAKHSTFLKQLFSLIPTKRTLAARTGVNSTMVYGISVIICNLITFRPRLSEEQQQMEKLRRAAKAGKTPSDADNTDSLDGDEYVKARIRLLIAAGVLPVFSAAISATDSRGVRLNVGSSLLSIVEEKENRGKVLQAGGVKVLQSIIKHSVSAGAKGDSVSTLDPPDLASIQALAKLSITSSPLQVFGPNSGAIYDAIKPLSVLLQHPSSNLLQRFEAIMALTNLASYSADMASRIGKVDGVVDKTELLLLEDHTLVRRASMELICNLIVGSNEVFERYGGDSPSSASKIHVLLALSDVDDMPTRLAASGALATLTVAPSACKALLDLQFERHRFLPIMTQLIDPTTLPDEMKDEETLETEPGLIHRGAVCVSNVFRSVKDDKMRAKFVIEGKSSGVIQALIKLAKGEGGSTDPSVMSQAAEAVKALVE